jgi:long-subunit acyl-CoA synthetase (AMP-forming)
MVGNIIVYTSGSTKEPKLVSHSCVSLQKNIAQSIKTIGLKSDDIVLDVYPANVIAHYTVTAIPALEAGATLISLNFDPYNYIKLFNQFKPTYISLIPRHIEILEKTKEWNNLDMSNVRYMVTGSQLISQDMIDTLLSKGVKTVANWYGMTEFPPPVFIGNNSSEFDFTPLNGNSVEFSEDGECIINGSPTGDIFDVKNKIFIRRKIDKLNNTWKS